MEPLSAVFLVFGSVILITSWLLLIQVSFQEDFTWGLCSIFIPPLAYFYGLYEWQKAQEPVTLALVGWVLLFLA